MQLTTWRPFQDLDDVIRRYTQSSDALLPSLLATGNGGAAWEPTADISETKDEYLVKAVLPGVEKEDIKVELTDDLLTISGKREHNSEESEETVHRVESFYGTFSRAFTLPNNVDTSNLSAECEKGVLCVHLPKTKVETPKPSANIPIK